MIHRFRSPLTVHQVGHVFSTDKKNICTNKKTTTTKAPIYALLLCTTRLSRTFVFPSAESHMTQQRKVVRAKAKGTVFSRNVSGKIFQDDGTIKYLQIFFS